MMICIQEDNDSKYTALLEFPPWKFERAVPRTISRRVAGIWFIWFLRSVSFVWFDERERQDRPAHQLDCL